jgi:hypothetical protein
MKNKNRSLLSLIYTFPSDLPFELVDEISTWDFIIKSPYGHSYYDAEVDWDSKPDQSLRISDHWNFTSQGKLHCETTTDVPNNTHWTIAIYDAIIKKYTPIKMFKKSKDSYKESKDFKKLLLKTKKESAINSLIKNCGDHPKIKEYLENLENDFNTQFQQLTN